MTDVRLHCHCVAADDRVCSSTYSNLFNINEIGFRVICIYVMYGRKVSNILRRGLCEKDYILNNVYKTFEKLKTLVSGPKVFFGSAQ